MPKKKSGGTSVQIYARVRKLMPWEPTQTSVKILSDDTVRNTTDNKTAEFTFSHVFNMKKTNEDMYKVMCKPLIRRLLDGYNAVLIAYGQTGSGKTYTLVGKPSLNLKGVLPLMLEALLQTDTVKKLEIGGVEAYGTHVSRVELFDLFAKENFVTDWTKKKGNSQMDPSKPTWQKVSNLKECWDKINVAHDNSHFAPTGKNPDSSRGHTAFITKITQEIEGDSLVSYLVVVDLAGSEGESAFTKEFIAKVDSATLMCRRLEAGCINNGLSQLQVVFNELKVKGRLSKVQGTGLRRILWNYINNKCVISVLFTLSPAKANSTTTASTLKFAVQAGMVKTKPVKSKKQVNYQKLVKELQEHIKQSDGVIEDLNDKVSELEDELFDKEREITQLKKKLENAPKKTNNKNNNKKKDDKKKNNKKSSGVKFDQNVKDNNNKSEVSPKKMKRMKSMMSMELTMDLSEFQEEIEKQQEREKEDQNDIVIAKIDVKDVDKQINERLRRHKTQKIDITLLNQSIRDNINKNININLDDFKNKENEDVDPDNQYNQDLLSKTKNEDEMDEDELNYEFIKDKTWDFNTDDDENTSKHNKSNTMIMDNTGGIEIKMVDTNALNREELVDYCDELEANLIEEQTLRKSLESSQQVLIDHLMETNEALLRWFQMKKILKIPQNDE